MSAVISLWRPWSAKTPSIVRLAVASWPSAENR